MDLDELKTLWAANDPAFANYHKNAGGDDQDFIDSVDPKWGGELPFTVLYARDGRKAAALSGKQSKADFEREIGKVLTGPARAQ